MTRGGVFFFERRGIFIILIRSYFTTRNNQESGKREKIREVRVTHLSVSARTRWFVHLSVICENLATAVEQICPRSRPSFAAKWGQLETRTPTASLPHSAQIYSVALIEVDRCSPRQMSCQRFASFSLSSPTPLLVYSSKCKRIRRIPYYVVSRSTQKKSIFHSPPNFVPYPG